MDAIMFSTSDSTDKLDDALAKAQAVMKSAKKDTLNPFFKSKYADLAAIWDACREALAAHGISVTQWPVHSSDGRLHIVTRIAHAGQWMKSHFSIPINKQDAQGYAGGATYAKRLALSAAVGVVAEDDDDDGNEASGKTNGHAIEVERRPSQSAKKIEADGVSAAREWYHGALSEVERAKTKADLNNWIAKNEKATDKLRLVLVDEWERLCEKVDARMKEFR